ncbi:hypothetical protein LSAT2_007354, partial [Lamellibrachia satsuma]
MMPSLRSSSMENRSWVVTRAPVIMVRGGSPQILDAVLYSQNTCWVVDASVVADNADLDNAHDSNDQWAAYHQLNQNNNYTYATVNHSDNFVDPATGVHTQA